MRFFTTTSLVLLFSSRAFGQTTITLPATVFEGFTNLQDASGNLVVIDSGAYLTNTTSIGRNGQTITTIARSPRTRITVLHPATTDSVVYATLLGNPTTYIRILGELRCQPAGDADGSSADWKGELS